MMTFKSRARCSALGLVPSALGLALLALLPEEAAAACDGSTDPIVISSNCEDLLISGTVSDVTIEQPATVSPFFPPLDAVQVSNTGQVTGTFTNKGTITNGFGWNGLVNHGTIAKFVNEGTITNNSSSSNHAAVINTNEIGTFENSGTISATVGNFGAGAHAIAQSGHIGSLTNTGTISAQNSAIYLVPGLTASIDTLTNTGTIEGGIAGGGSSTFASAIVLGAGNSIGTINNTGTIDHSVCQGGTCYAAIDNQGGTIGTINNLGRLSSGNTGSDGYGIINGITGRIGTLNNDQADLRYYGTLPQNYLAIVYGPSTYGAMSVTAASGVMNFGVDAAAPIGTSTYANVLSGIGQANLAETSGSWGGGFFNNSWELSSVNDSQWDLSLTSQAIVPSIETSSGESLAEAIIATATEAASEVVPPGTLVPTLVNGVTLQQAAQNITPDQATQFSAVTAEGYSSNLTINLQQMGMISEAVTDRIHSQSSAPDMAKADVSDAAPSRRIWVDGSATRGTVDGYDGLSGFSYNLFDIIAGADLLRDSSGGLGVFGGAGYSSMTESADVPQDFTTASYFAGLYGGMDVSETVRLAGSLGYVYGYNEATRHNVDIGDFTGGSARSDYSSNGLFGTLKVARSFAMEEFTLSPFAGVSYAQLWADEAKESGGGDFNYTISSATAYTAVLFVGSDFAMPLSQTTGGALSLVGFAKVGYDVFANDDDAHSITATSSTYGSFEQVGADMGPILSTFGLGIEADSDTGLSGRIGAVASLNSNGYQFGAGGELRW